MHRTHPLSIHPSTVDLWSLCALSSQHPPTEHKHPLCPQQHSVLSPSNPSPSPAAAPPRPACPFLSGNPHLPLLPSPSPFLHTPAPTRPSTLQAQPAPFQTPSGVAGQCGTRGDAPRPPLYPSVPCRPSPPPPSPAVRPFPNRVVGGRWVGRRGLGWAGLTSISPSFPLPVTVTLLLLLPLRATRGGGKEGSASEGGRHAGRVTGSSLGVAGDIGCLKLSTEGAGRVYRVLFGR